jgi:hypothetical protein
LENIRFDPREASKDDEQRKELAKDLAELVGADGAFVSDGFGVVHRKQASVYDVATLLPHYAGTLVAAEVKVLEQLKQQPTLLIQEIPITPYYSPYAEIRIYDADIASRITTSGVNQLSATLLNQAGFRSWRWLNISGQPVRVPATASGSPAGQPPQEATYRLWRRMR